jgi:uncharacterized protein YggU (UPF0235/DUF167 family)
LKKLFIAECGCFRHTASQAMQVKVRVTPGMKKERFEELANGRFVVSVREKAERNAANRRVRELLAEHFGVAVGMVRMVSGHRSRSKLFTIDL